MRRKTIANNLNTIVGNKDLTAKILLASSITDNKRPEEIEPEEYVTLYSNFQKIKTV